MGSATVNMYWVDFRGAFVSLFLKWACNRTETALWVPNDQNCTWPYKPCFFPCILEQIMKKKVTFEENLTGNTFIFREQW